MTSPARLTYRETFATREDAESAERERRKAGWEPIHVYLGRPGEVSEIEMSREIERKP